MTLHDTVPVTPQEPANLTLGKWLLAHPGTPVVQIVRVNAGAANDHWDIFV